MQRVVKVDGKIRMDKCFPCGIMGTLLCVCARAVVRLRARCAIGASVVRDPGCV